MTVKRGEKQILLEKVELMKEHMINTRMNIKYVENYHTMYLSTEYSLKDFILYFFYYYFLFN